ncbi:MAG: YitT family protein [Candidatus Limivicinus sp.]|jgi:uncharacterized membrane-anchored protein YitT (DUF2179 family)
MKNTTKTFLKETAVEILGSFLIAIGIYNFAVASKFPMTGFSGIALILYRLFELPIGLTTIVLNIPVAILCYKLLGRGFLLRSVRCIIISSLMIDYLAPLLPVYTGNRMISALCTGFFAGLGYAIIYAENSSTGGTDFIVMAVKAVKPYLPLGNIVFLSDLGIVLLGGIIFKDVDGIVYGLIIDFLFAVVVDKVIYGINSGKFALIVSDNHGQEIADAIDEGCGRGSTIISGRGGFRGDRKELVLVACDNKQMYFVKRIVRRVDPAAFTVILESNEVHGEGFHMLSIGEKN